MNIYYLRQIKKCMHFTPFVYKIWPDLSVFHSVNSILGNKQREYE